MKVIKELFIAMFWVFLILIVGYFVLDFVINRNIPLASTFASWVEKHSQAGA
jgi:hypothetical protein